jgi:hypothetical protein
MERVNWNEARSIRAAALRAGNSPGVYLIGGLHETAGIPMFYEWIYVGRTNRLGRRLIEHLPANESNPQLRTWLRTEKGILVVRFAVIPEDESIRVEKDLIRSLAPKHNRIMFKNRENNDHTIQYA